MGHVGYVDPYSVATCRTLDRDRIVEVFGVGAVYGHRGEVTQVPALPHLPACEGLGLLIDLSRELPGGTDGGEERFIDVARVLGRSDDARYLAPERAVSLAGVHEDYVAGLSAPTKLACDQHRTPLLYEERVCYRVLPPTDQHSRKYQESAPIRGIWQSTLRVYHAASPRISACQHAPAFGCRLSALQLSRARAWLNC